MTLFYDLASRRTLEVVELRDGRVYFSIYDRILHPSERVPAWNAQNILGNVFITQEDFVRMMVNENIR